MAVAKKDIPNYESVNATLPELKENNKRSETRIVWSSEDKAVYDWLVSWRRLNGLDVPDAIRFLANYAKNNGIMPKV